MLKNVSIVSLRSLLKDKGYTLLNILGLTAGITFSLLLLFYIMDEVSDDRFNEQAQHIYRISHG
jgi:putative ABC transport system permease protein